jgi:transcriptional regulator with XRE-family HTH domain
MKIHKNDKSFKKMKETVASSPHLGLKLAPLRAAAGITIEQLAGKAGVSAGLLSQLERGKGNPGFNTLAKIAYALNVPIGTFFSGPVPQDPVVRRNKRKKLTHAGPWTNGESAPVYELLTPDLQRKLEVIWVELPPGQSNEEQPFVHDTEECGVLLSGVLEVHLGDETYTLREGDSISFHGLVPHWYRNPGKKPAISIWIITPPSF